MKTYSEKLSDPRWKIVRKRILERDGRCVECGSQEDLHVHHTYYEKRREPWQYDDEVLKTLCEICHTRRHIHEAYLMEDLSNLSLNELDIVRMLIVNARHFGLKKSHDMLCEVGLLGKWENK